MIKRGILGLGIVGILFISATAETAVRQTVQATGTQTAAEQQSATQVQAMQPGAESAAPAAESGMKNSAEVQTQSAVQAQMPAQQQGPAFTQEQLDQAMAPVALYPDSLLAQILMASTYPDQIAQAAEWSKANPNLKGDDAVKAVQDKNWDPSVASLTAFPQVLDMMRGKNEWVKTMGDAFLADPDAVVKTIQKLRKKAKDAGNLKSTKEQKVVVNSDEEPEVIEIHPAEPEKVYVPVYNPTVVYGPWWYPAYPPYFYSPPYYNPAGAIIGFAVGVAIVHSLWCHWDWRRHDVNINVNRYNSINVNRRLNMKQNAVSWRNNLRQRNPRSGSSRLGNRLGAARPAVGDGSRPLQKPGLVNRPGGENTRPALDGKDVRRKQIEQAMKQKGLDLGKERQKLKTDQSRINSAVQRANTQNRIGGVKSGQGLKERAARPATGLQKSVRPSTPKVKRPSVSKPTVSKPSVSKPARVSRPAVSRPARVSRPVRARPARPAGGRVRRR